MAEIATITTELEHLLTEILQEEWTAQGHAMTSKIIDDIDYKVKQEVNKLILTGMIYPYGNIIAAGVKPGKVPFGGTAKRGQGAGEVSKYIQALQKYAQIRMHISDEKKSLGVAFAIAKTQKKEGMPTWNSYSFSQTGKRMDWVEEAFRKNEGKIMEVVSNMGQNVISLQIDALIQKWNIALNEKN